MKMPPALTLLCLLPIAAGSAATAGTEDDAPTANQRGLAGKTIVIMGDSSTTAKMWPEAMQRLYLPAACHVVNTAGGGTHWEHIAGQWSRAKNALGDQRPDIVIITTGGNKFPDPASSYDDIIGLCENTALEPLSPAAYAVLSLREIIQDAPAVDLYVVSNFYAGSNPAKNRTRRAYRTQLTALCDYFSCNLIDLTRQSNIRGYLEKDPAQRLFTSDSVHADTPAGKERIARIVYSTLLQNYPPPK
ncbi:MAG: SGNH/GDSL hydrolase family protein [Lentisphaeria bacterium]|nr:SGNH/GDSL hydrolase family protein [Lentisphaeria bacterium]